MSKKVISLLLMIILFLTAVLNCYGEVPENQEIYTQVFVRQELLRQFSLIYDTFSAAITLEDGSEITGIGFTDYSAYYEADDKSVGYFPAGFIADYGYELPPVEDGKAFVIENLDFIDERYQFVYDCETVPFMEHCIKDGQYLKYGVNEQGAITYEASKYERGFCDESLGALFSYDTGKFVFDPDMGNYVKITGNTLFEAIDYDAIEAQVNQIIADQNNRLSEQEIISSVHIAQEAIISYLLSMQQETFLEYKVDELIDYASQLDPMECIRITPDGMVIIKITGDIPGGPDELTKWIVGIGCGIAIIASTTLNFFVPVARPLCGAITSAAFDVFMQVVINNKTLENVQWEKVAVAAVSGATLAWLCPLAASGVTDIVTKAGGKVLGKTIGVALGKLAGYGVMTLSSGLVNGIREFADANIDGKDGWEAFKYGLFEGVKYTAIASVAAEVVPFLGSKAANLLSKTNFGSKLIGWVNKAGLWIQGKQIHLPEGYENIESILSPKSVHQAAESAWKELCKQADVVGGSYNRINTPGDGSKERHEVISFSANNAAKGIEGGSRGDMPSVLMDAADHRRTASWGSSLEAQQFREAQTALLQQGNYHDALQMGIDDFKQFGNKYDIGIEQMLDYATNMGWW